MTSSGYSDPRIPIVDLSKAPGQRESWDAPRWKVYLWGAVELLLVTNPWQISSSLRVHTLRAFGARIGSNVVFRPRTRVRFPWKLTIGDNCWIGEGAWFHNQDHIRVGANVVVSQESFLTTGSHAHRRDMALLTRPIRIHDGVWLTARCVVLGGTEIGQSVLAKPMTIVQGRVPPNVVVEGPRCEPVGQRFELGDQDGRRS
ncbi:acetyltransferase [Curtobacterium sp. MCPF17_046]|uniref:acetyltransferase n=1 Tax=Curtobacterium sp. MCPF17_046 TaxID=2175663 RepID=UPI000D9E1874|nr:acetyltransferase [Curtobacterium sp. MCPF17_046]PYY39026.1 acetyltransferase [Curtobacterium sp. MCPF17_046]